MSKRTLFIILTVAAILGIAIANYFSAIYIKQKLIWNLEVQYTHQQQSIAHEIAKILEIEVASDSEKLTLIAQMPEVRDGDTEVCNAKLQEVFDSMQSKLGNLARINKDGVFQCSINKALIGVPGKNLGAYVTTIFEDPEHKPVMSRALEPPGVNTHAAAIHVPVYDTENNFIGTVGGAIYFDQIAQKYLKDIELDEGGFAVLFDDDGTILYHPETYLIGKNFDAPEVKSALNPESSYQEMVNSALKDRKGYKNFSFKDVDKQGVFTPVKIFPGREWVVLVTVPVKSINTALVDVGVEDLFAQSIFVSTAVSLILGGIFLLTVIFSVFNPISKITAAAEQIGSGNLNTKVDITSQDEMGKLARVFNQMTAQLKTSYELLEEKVHLRTRELETANQKLLQLDKLKDEFVSVASHELRTPMTAIKGFLSMILEGEYGKVPEKLQQPLQDVYTSSDRLIHLVGDMLNVSRIEAGRLRFSLKVFDVKPLVERVVSTLQPLAQEKKIELIAQVSECPEVQADPEKVEQILLNLLGNAWKFTDTGSITVSVLPGKDCVEILVTDTGMGISPEDQAKVFKKFIQITNQQAGRPAGTGLGLYISKELAVKMGGDLIITHSEVGVGTTFKLTVPVAASSSAKTAEKEISTEAQAHPDQK